MKKENVLMVLCGALFLLSVSLLLFPGWTGKITGHASSEISTTSNVSISKYLSINMSDNLAEGIIFGTTVNLPATDLNASHNYDGAGSGSSMSVTVGVDSNTNVDFCVKASGNLMTDALDVLGLGNETYSNASVATSPSLPGTALTTSFVKGMSNINEGDSVYYRFWLDVPAAQASGDYNNTVYFKGVQTGQAC
jgi:hypothetical protein